jgi:serine phosphatase RsbU (regulator of sigma subunit)
MRQLLLLISFFLISESLFSQEKQDSVAAATLQLEETNEGTFEVHGEWLFLETEITEYEKLPISATSWEPRETIIWPWQENGTYSEHGWYLGYLSLEDSVHKDFDAAAVYLRGAAEVYINGSLWQRHGKPATSVDDEVLARNFNFFPVQWHIDQPNEIVVRFSNHRKSTLADVGIYTGFVLMTGTYEAFVADQSQTIRTQRRTVGYTIIGFAFAFLLLHLLLFILNQKDRYNLAYVILLVTYILVYLMDIESDSQADVDILYWLYFGETVLIIALHMAILFMIYLFATGEIPLIGYVILALGAATIMKHFYIGNRFFEWLNPVVFFLTYAEIVRFMFKIRYNDKKANVVAFGGGITLILGLTTVVVSVFDVRHPILQFIESNAFAGMIVLFVSMTAYLAMKMTETTHKLELKIEETKKLSEENLIKEREQAELRLLNEQQQMRAQIAELQAEAIQKEDQRKSIELEEARKLQLSMLPQTLPKRKGVNLAAFVQTASEVGGDYYDYHRASADQLLLALGDATGHGVGAGTMVTATKALFQNVDEKMQLPAMLSSISVGLRLMNFKRVFMSMSLLQIYDDYYVYTSAGMPAMLHLSKSTQDIKEVLCKGMALGTSIDFPYQQKSFDFKEGDCLILMTDGLTELINADNQMMPSAWLEEKLLALPKWNADIVSQTIRSAIKDWRGESPLRDDVSVLVISKDG